jgi:hypothetical protein
MPADATADHEMGMLVQLAKGRPIRGGLDVGVGAVVDGELFGAGLVKAYNNESERAKHPRVVAGKDLIQYLDAKSHDPGTDFKAQFERGMAHQVRDFLIEDFEDGEWVLDYAGPKMRETMLNPETSQMLVAARAFAHNSRLEFQARGNQKLFERYSKVLRYLDARIAP